ncbi:MAG TPA: serine/threonine-protein kinase [Streptosporangiaceae bacterium]|nr:serine/threonine-protein kinase [Streptosporangiaceae bacterium]
MTQDIHSGPGDLAPGEQLAGYEIQERIGRGGMAVVYRALDLRLGRLVALKVLAPQLSEDDAFRQRFMRESRAAAGVEHPHIVPVFEAGEAAGVLFIAMRYVAGGDVRSLIEADGRLKPARTVRIASQVASALDAAHAYGLIHRDVKPANILLGQASGSDSDHVYLSDFGLSKQSVGVSTLTSTGQFLGTLDYVAPEQIQGHPIDGRADQYGLACAVVEMLTGAPPFRRDDSMALMWAQLEAAPPRLTERRPDLPPAVDEVVGAAMSKAPAGRYPTCRDFAAALAAACAQQLPRSGPPAVQSQPAAGDSFPTDPFPRTAPPADRLSAEGFAADGFAADGFAADEFRADPPPTRTQTMSPGRRDGDRRDGDRRDDGPVPGSAEPFRQPSVHAAWPATTAATRHDGIAPPTRSQQRGRGQADRRRQRQHRARSVLLGLLIFVVGLGGAAGIAYKLSHRHLGAPPHHPTVTMTVSAGGGLTPDQTVREYFAAINHRRYLEAWRLSGETEPYPKFRAGYAGTLRDDVTIVAVNGNVVTAKLSALQASGKVKTFRGTYTITNGIISATNVIQTS